MNYIFQHCPGILVQSFQWSRGMRNISEYGRAIPAVSRGIYLGVIVCIFVSLLPECDFEENHLCGFVNHWNPNVNWFVGGGNIRNSPSVLLQDHTFKSELGELGTDGVLFPGGSVSAFPSCPLH